MYGQILSTAIEAARAGARVLEGRFRRPDLGVRTKTKNDLVSLADEESEEAIVQTIAAAFPDHEVLGEERGLESCAASDFQWILDPLDGTTNFVEGLPIYCVSVACRHGDELVAGVVLEPPRQNLFAAAKGEGATWNGEPMRVSPKQGLVDSFLATGFPFKAHPALDLYLDVFRNVFLEVRAIRRCGAAALDLAYTAAGIFDGFYEFRLAPWDVAAGTVLIREAGGVVSDLDGGDDHLERGNIVAGGEALHGALLELIRRYADEAALDRLVPLTAVASVT